MANKALIAKARMGVQARFDDELRGFLYAFAGDSDPQKDTVDLLNDMTVDFIAKTTAEAVMVARSVGCPLNHESVLFTVRNDPLKRERMNKLLHSFDEIKRLRTANAKDLAGNLKKITKAASSEKIEKASAAGGGASGQKKEKRSANPKSTESAEKPKRTKKPKDPSKSTPSSAAKSPVASGGGPEAGKSTIAATPSSSAAAPTSSEPQQTEFMMMERVVRNSNGKSMTNGNVAKID